MPKTLKGKGKKKRDPITLTLVNSIIRRVSEGETLAQICRDDGMPPESTVRSRINLSSSLLAAYARAREERAERMADEIIEIADDGRNDYVQREGKKPGSVVIAFDDEHVRRSQLRIDTRKFLLARVLPHKYGERVQHTGEGGGPIAIEHSLSAPMLANLQRLRDKLPSLPTLSTAGAVDAAVVSVRPGKVS